VSILFEEKVRVMKKYALASVAIMVLVIVAGFSIVGSGNEGLNCFACDGGGVVDKTPCEAFMVKVGFKNTGKTEGTWSVNIAFEGEKWTWSGAAQNLTLKPNKSKTLAWNGEVPCDAPVDSVARLIVYYNDSFVALDWWIHVISDAKLTITSSNVE
jgi:hypothetical protein